MYLKELLVYMQRLVLETDFTSSQYEALRSAIQRIVETHNKEGIIARDAVIHIMESTFLLPGVFNVQMLSWRQRLQDIVHTPHFLSGHSSLNYILAVNFETANGFPATRTVAVQTKISNPNVDELLEFHQRSFELQWVLK